jgi:hypothetical protein
MILDKNAIPNLFKSTLPLNSLEKGLEKNVSAIFSNLEWLMADVLRGMIRK